MRELKIYIEINGSQTPVGTIKGKDYHDASFSYDAEYLSAGESAPISISLPFQKEPFSPKQTRNYFESLLPEGFSKKAVAEWIKADEKDYVTILSVLGKECLGAVKIVEGDFASKSQYDLLSEIKIKELAVEGATRSTQILMETHLSLTGATGKVGLYYDEASGKWFLPKGDAPSTHIVKQSHVRLKQIVLNEQLCIIAARNLGINTPESFIINKGSGDDEMLFATRRYDRVLSDEKHINSLRRPLRLHQEDFAQALSILPEEKYEKKPSMYMQKMFELIRNYSLLYSADLKSKRLAPIYDLVATRVYKTTSEMSFFIGGELDIEKINRMSFGEAADEIGMASRMVLNIFDDVAENLESSFASAADELGNLGYEQAGELKKKILESGGYKKIK